MLTAIACTKFKEDSFISLRRPEHRLYGTWHVDYYEIDGIDSTDYFYKSQYTATQNINFYYSKEDEGYICDWGGLKTFYWVDKKKMHWACYYIPNKSGIAFKQYIMSISKLYKNDFWVSGDEYGKHYFIKMKKISK
jgi:hypothetical protein